MGRRLLGYYPTNLYVNTCDVCGIDLGKLIDIKDDPKGDSIYRVKQQSLTYSISVNDETLDEYESDIECCSIKCLIDWGMKHRNVN